MAAMYAAIGCWPFGEKSILVLDLNGQYVYFFEGLRRIVREGGSLLYSWSRSMGGEFMGIFAYYLSSPFSFITVFFPDGYITESLMLIVLLKVGCMSGTITYYLHRKRGGEPIKIIMISTMYALSSYAVVQAHNTMWIDCLIYLPLLTFALEELVKKGHFRMYTVVLSLSIMSNFYIGYMMCIYCVIYFIYYYVSRSGYGENNLLDERYHFGKSCLRFGLSSAISAGISAWIIWPAYYSLLFGKTTFSEANFTPTLKFDPLDFFSKLFIGSYDTVEPEGLPFIYCGTLMLVLLPLYFLSKKINPRRKICAGVLLSTFVVSFIVSTVDIFWHGMQTPNWLNYRYSFMFIFAALVFCYEILLKIEQIDFTKTAVICAVIILTVFTLQKLGYENISTEAVVGTFVAVVAILLALHTVKYNYLERGGILILCVVVCVEMFSAAVMNTVALDEDVTISTRQSYNEFMDRYQPSVDRIKKNDTGFYRMEKTKHRKTNDSFTLGYKGLSGSTSTLNQSQIRLLNQLGYASKSHWSKYLGGTPVSDSLLGVKYLISDTQLSFNTIHQFEYEDAENGLYTYINPYALSVAFGVNEQIKDLDFSAFDNPFERMNAIVTAMLGETETVELFKELPVEELTTDNMTSSYSSGCIKYTAQNESDNARLNIKTTAIGGDCVYLYIPSSNPKEADLTVNTYSKGTYFGNETMRIVELGYYNRGQKLTVTLSPNEDDIYIDNNQTKFIYTLDSALFKEIMPLFGTSRFEVSDYTDTNLNGTINVSEGETTVFTSVVYDEGWHIAIDGKEVEIYKLGDALIGFDITPGEHTIEMTYLPTSFITSYIISAVCIVGFGVLCAIYTKSKKKKKQYTPDVVDTDE